MRNLRHAASITESDAAEVIFNACRGNPGRSEVTLKRLDGMKVTVSFHQGGYYKEHNVRVVDANGFPIATATVDDIDC